jgi:hypothetical protein
MRIMTLTNEPENELFDQFRVVDTSVKRATDEFRDSADRQAQCRREFVQVMKNQLNIMMDLRENQERNRKFVKNALKESNATYIGFRTKEIPKVSGAKRSGLKSSVFIFVDLTPLPAPKSL